MTLKDLRKIIAEKKKEMERESKFYNPSYYWKGRKIVSLEQWFQVENYSLKAALQYFPNDFPSFGFSYILDNIEDQRQSLLAAWLDLANLPIQEEVRI